MQTFERRQQVRDLYQHSENGVIIGRHPAGAMPDDHWYVVQSENGGCASIHASMMVARDYPSARRLFAR